MTRGRFKDWDHYPGEGMGSVPKMGPRETEGDVGRGADIATTAIILIVGVGFGGFCVLAALVRYF